jgi:DNA-binding NarL/FixJ family response regulator
MALSTYRSKNEPQLRVPSQDEALQFARGESEDAASPSRIEKLLTPREAEIARFVAAGLSNKQIARKASIAEATGKIHLHNTYQKLGIANRSTLAVLVSSGAGAWAQGQ